MIVLFFFIKDVYCSDEVPQNANGRIHKVLSELDVREEKVIRLRYGLDDDVQKTPEEIGRIFGVTEKTIQQMLDKAIKKLRSPAMRKKLFGD